MTLARKFWLALFSLLITFAFTVYIYSISWEIAIDFLLLLGLTVMPGMCMVDLLNRKASAKLFSIEIISLGAAIGFFIPVVVLQIVRLVHLPQATVVTCVGIPALSLVYLGSRIRSLSRNGLSRLLPLGVIATLMLLWFAFYNLHQFQITGSGVIITRQYFGTDLPFLIGEIHGLRTFHTLRDLHQSAQPWVYHDATYRLLALLPASHTMEDVVFVLPLVGYVLLLFSVLVLFHRLTPSRWYPALAAAGFFLIGNFKGTEKGIYAISPSFVIGSLILLNVLLLIVITIKERPNWQRSIILGFLILQLSQTKIPSFLPFAAAAFLAAVMWRKKYPSLSVALVVPTALGMAIVAVQAFHRNPLMPGNDFVIGYPLYPYAAALAKHLHVALASVNPISNLRHLRIESLLILPYFLLHLIHWTLFGLLPVVVVLIAARRSHSVMASAVSPLWHFCIMLIVAGILLPVLYTPAWYPDALTFYAPLVSLQAGLLLSLFGFWLLFQNRSERSSRIAIGILAIMFAIGIVQNFRFHYSDRLIAENEVPASLAQALAYLQERAPDTSILATRRYDTRKTDTAVEGYFWYSAISAHPVVSEGADEGALLAAVAENDPNRGLHPVPAATELLKSRRLLLDTIYLSDDSARVTMAIHKARAKYILEDGTIGQRLAINPWRIANLYFSNGICRIWEVR